MPSLVGSLLAALLSLAAAPAAAWSNHAVLTWPALQPVPEVARAAPVPVERLAGFLRVQSGALEKLFADEEAWARTHVPDYPARPDALAWHALPPAAADGEQVARFVAAVRLNPAARLNLFLQLKPGEASAGRAVLGEADVTPLTATESTKFDTFVALHEGEPVPPIDVVATASDEPDYGLDVGLWSDNGTAHGAVYGMGKQPFGNPALDFSSQGPIHIGYFHEAAIVYSAAPFLRRCYPEARIHLWRTLAAHAFKTGHAYWGWRFTGWALHYAQDLTQPYHARVLPGVGLLRMLAINALDLAGLHGAKADAIARVTNRHLALENFEVRWVRSAIESGRVDDMGLRALRGEPAADAVPYTEALPREVITGESYALADSIDAVLATRVPARYIDDPKYTFGVTEAGIDLYRELERTSPAGQRALMEALVPLLRNAGRHTRAFVGSLVVR